MATMTENPTATKANAEMEAIGLNFERWQDAVEAAISTNLLTVTGEIRDGQLIQFADPSAPRSTSWP